MMKKQLIAFFCLIQVFINLGDVLGQDLAKKVFVMEIKAEIDTRVSRYVSLALEEATKQEVDIIVIEMDTYGGLVTDAKDIVELLLDQEKPVWVFINKDAASAGALISIACDSIYMSPGA
ncbi:MAG: nodulation protein NfeD, partial [Cyclobacteriaceae bacterium]|nr:nodulation protein NfeD [Cyclobacteriaceae bacterium]